MTYDEFLACVVDDGIAAARRDYAAPRDAMKLRGAVEGFEVCRGLLPPALALLLREARQRRHWHNAFTQDAARIEQASDYWRVRCREAEIEWVCNVVSAMLQNEGMSTIVQPTARGALRAAAILGVRDEKGRRRQ